MKFKKIWKHPIYNDERGSFVIAAAFGLPMLFIAGGMALDISNTMSLKERMQSAADSTSLTVTTRMATGNLSIEDAESLASNLFAAQVTKYNDRYVQLGYDADIDVTEVVDGSITTWRVVINADASIKTTGLSSLVGMDVMDVSINSSATTSNEEVQGAFSMAVVVDVSGSMYWPTDQAAAMQSILSEDRGDASRASTNIYEAHYLYGLEQGQIQFIIQNYDVDDCEDVAAYNSDRSNFLSSIGEPTTTDSQTAYNYCYGPAYAAEKVGADNLLDNWDEVFANVDASKLRLLKTAASTMFNQMTEADPEAKYVRTASASYNTNMTGNIEFAWGVSHSNNFIENLSANGGTASTDAMDWAFDTLKLSDGTEISEHESMNGQVPDRFIVFMTDGSNNHGADDVATKAICDQAKSDGIDIFSVAFAAPTRGQNLLNYCATSSDYYFEPETADELIDVFEFIGSQTMKTLTRLTY